MKPHVFTTLCVSIWYSCSSAEDAVLAEYAEAAGGVEVCSSSVVLLQRSSPTLVPELLVGGTVGNGTAAASELHGDRTSTNLTVSLGRMRNDMIGVIFAAVDRENWDYDVFTAGKKDIPDRHTLFNAAPGSEWLVLVCFVACCLIFDVFVLQKFERSKLVNAVSLIFWVFCGLAYNLYFLIRYNKRHATDWFMGFLLEWMLSMDNLFVFHLIFKVYKTPEKQMHKALIFGIAGAVGLRMIFFLALGSLLHMFDWVRFVFGAILIWSGVEAIRGDDDDEDVTSLYSVRTLKWIFGPRLLEKYDEEDKALFMRNSDGKICVTLLFFVVLCLELTDILFAVDSVSAKVAQIADQYIAYSSSVVAIFSLRSMFFVIHDLVDVFELLKYGLAFILIFIGSELMLSRLVTVSPSSVCIIILGVFVTCIGGSVAKKKLARPAVENGRSA